MLIGIEIDKEIFMAITTPTRIVIIALLVRI
jgi:hypothetical protein